MTADGRFRVYSAKCVILATGGYGQIYLNNNNAPGINGDGLVLAYELGLPLKDMEFVQFYPTALGSRRRRIVLYEDFVMVGGAVIRNAAGEDIGAKHGLQEPSLFTRDNLARAIMTEITNGLDVDGGVVLDLSPVPPSLMHSWRSRLPANMPLEQRELIVGPTTHFCMGGLVVDGSARTAVPGLYAAGEICGGVHGANRLAGNALSEVFALGALAGAGAGLEAEHCLQAESPLEEIEREKNRLEEMASQNKMDLGISFHSLKEAMWNGAGIIKTKNLLEKTLERLIEIGSCPPESKTYSGGSLFRQLEFHNALLVAEMGLPSRLGED